MSDKKIITKRHSKQGELILTLDLDPLKNKLRQIFVKLIFRPLFNLLKFISTSLNTISGKKSYLLLSSGLGLGIGLGLIIAFYPAPVLADIPAPKTVGIEIARVKSTDIGIDTQVKRGKMSVLPLVSLEAPAVHLETSAGIGSGQPIIIQGLNKDYSLNNLQRAQLGDEIFIIGSNGGWYRYRVVETKTVKTEDIHSYLSASKEVAILYTLNAWQKTATLVIARPRI
mgnify:CR=1 FL=1